jgi:hypothetical protein
MWRVAPPRDTRTKHGDDQIVRAGVRQTIPTRPTIR